MKNSKALYDKKVAWVKLKLFRRKFIEFKTNFLWQKGSWRSTFSKNQDYYTASINLAKMRLLIIFTFITAQFLLSVQASEEMPDLYCGDKNCYEGKLFLFKILIWFCINKKTSMFTLSFFEFFTSLMYYKLIVVLILF